MHALTTLHLTCLVEGKLLIFCQNAGEWVEIFTSKYPSPYIPLHRVIGDEKGGGILPKTHFQPKLCRSVTPQWMTQFIMGYFLFFVL